MEYKMLGIWQCLHLNALANSLAFHMCENGNQVAPQKCQNSKLSMGHTRLPIRSLAICHLCCQKVLSKGLDLAQLHQCSELLSEYAVGRPRLQSRRVGAPSLECSQMQENAPLELDSIHPSKAQFEEVHAMPWKHTTARQGTTFAILQVFKNSLRLLLSRMIFLEVHNMSWHYSTIPSSHINEMWP